MPESAQNAANQDGNTTGGATSDAGTAFTPITSQDEFNQRLAGRLEQQRRQFADYDDYKAKAAKWDAAEQANKTELERAQQSAADATARGDKAEHEALRLRVALAKGLPASLVDRLRGANEQELTADADELLKLVTPSSGTGQQPAPRPDLSQGVGSTGSSNDPAAQFAAFLGKQLTH